MPQNTCQNATKCGSTQYCYHAFQIKYPFAARDKCISHPSVKCICHALQKDILFETHGNNIALSINRNWYPYANPENFVSNPVTTVIYGNIEQLNRAALMF